MAFGLEQSFRELLDALPAAIYTTDTAGRITFYNEAAAELWGQRPDLQNSQWCGSWRLYWPDGTPMPHEQCPMAQALKEGRAIRGAEAIAERPDGSRVHFVPYPTLLHDDSGAVTGAVNMLVDISDRRQSEQRLWELQAELGHLSRLGALGQMAAALAHELNQPLTANLTYIQSCLHVLRDGTDEQSAFLRGMLDKATEQARRAAEIVRLTRKFASRGHSEAQPENIIALVHEATTLALVGSKQFGARVGVQFDAQVECVRVNKVQIQQVLVNLIRNAVEAMQEVNRCELLISVTQPEADKVQFSVVDTGPGLAPEVAAKLFQPFVTTKENGMGIGLSVCRNIIDAADSDEVGRAFRRDVGHAFRSMSATGSD
jgi:two-component system, LuxR family, sensor kinase FixL